MIVYLILLFIIIYLIMLIIAWIVIPRDKYAREKAIERLEERYKNKEITEKEFEEKKKDISS